MEPDPVYIKQRAAQLYRSDCLAAWRGTDRLFAGLLVFQWLVCIALAVWYTPHTFLDRNRYFSTEVTTAVALGAAIIGLPLYLIFRQPGGVITRHAVAFGQMGCVALLIHLTNGLAETHYHIFASLVILAFYRDWRVLVTATVVVGLDLGLRGHYWPQSVFGDGANEVVNRWRWLEHVGWVLFEDVFLALICLQGERSLLGLAQRRAELEESQGSVERAVVERSTQYAQTNRDLQRQIGELKRAEQDFRAVQMESDNKVRSVSGEVSAAARALKRQVEDSRRTEEELARTISRYRFLTDSLPQMVWTAKPNGEIDYFNRRTYEYTGRTVEESMHSGWIGVIHPDDQARSTERMQQAVATGETLDSEIRIRRGTDGAYRWHLSRAVPMRDADGNVIQWFGTCTDIDDQKRARETALRSEQRYRSLVTASTQIVWLLDAECRMTTDLPEWREATGQTFEQSAGYGWMEAIHPDDREHARDLWRWAVETRTVYENELRLRMADGSYRCFNKRGVPVRESDGRVREWIGTCIDITDRKQAEVTVRRAQEDLEARVKERTAQLTETNRILHQQVIERKQIEAELAEARDDALNSAKLKSQFLANMSHEIRTPMNGVIGMTSLLLDTNLDQEQREYIETIRASGDGLLAIINDILDFSKIEAGRLDFEELDLDLQSTVEGAIELLAEKATAKGLDLACHVLEDVPRQLRGDPGRLRQVIVNLVGNAIKFTTSGRVLVHVAKLQETADDAQLCFQVSDTGIGLSEDAIRTLFQAFVQADGSTTRKFGGTGLGLAISKQLVELMGGEIGVESAVGQGSTFWFTVRLPKQPILVADEDNADDPAVDFSAGRALIVGSSGTGEVLREQLGSWGMGVQALTDGRQGLAALQEAANTGKGYHFLLADAQLPGMDGPVLAQTIKNDPALAACRVIILLAPGQRSTFSSGEGSDIAACLSKPVKRSQLRDLLRTLLATASRPAAAPQVRLKAGPQVRPLKGKGVRVLIAEDNQVNQKVVIKQLEKIGFKADAVANGAEALAATAKVAYDLVLMDCQMPEMDGFAATREIRRREEEFKMHTPIVALTANALEGDRDRCLAAGMDDYLSKPIKIEQLRTILERWATDAVKEAEGPQHAAAA